MKRRYLLTGLIGVASLPVVRAFAATTDGQGRPRIEKLERSAAEWRQLLTPAQFRVLREDGPAPTGERWCNNGVALRFVLAGA